MTDDPRERFLREAIALALDAVRAGTGGPFGALVVRGGEVLGRGQNRVLERNDPTAHAEIEAIRAACARIGAFDLAGCELYASCEPCPMCLGAIYWARLKRVVHAASREDAARAGFDDARFWIEIERESALRALPMLARPSAEARAPFDAWLAKSDRRLY